MGSGVGKCHRQIFLTKKPVALDTQPGFVRIQSYLSRGLVGISVCRW